MICRLESMPKSLAALLAACLVAGCATAPQTPTPRPTPTISRPTATPSIPSGTPSASIQASPTATDIADPFPHLAPSLEAMLPSVIGGVSLTKFSLPMSTYVSNSTGGDKVLLIPWLIHFGRTADATPIAIAADLARNENFLAQAIQVPGAKAQDLMTEMTAQVKKAGWPMKSSQIAGRSVLQVVDTAVSDAGGVGSVCMLAVGDVLFVVVTDDPALLVEALLRLPK